MGSSKISSKRTFSNQEATAAGPDGIAVTPPAYGIDAVDNQIITTGLAYEPAPVVEQNGARVQPKSGCDSDGGCRLRQDNLAIQPRLRIGKQNDQYEREAERAERAYEGSAIMPETFSSVMNTDGVILDNSTQQTVNAALNGGQPLPTPTRNLLENRFEYNFSDVNIHTGATANQATELLSAHAFTIGNDIVFNDLAYQPTTTSGQQLIAHELTHVIQQQSAKRPDGRIQRAGWGERFRRGLRRGRRYGSELRDRVHQIEEQVTERGSEAADEVSEWWHSGSGDVTKIEFDGSQVRLLGSASYTAPAVSGLMPGHPNIRAAGLPLNTDCTQPQYQNVPDIGPIPEGDYYVNPDEVESNPPGTFPRSAWGRYRTRLHETTGTNLARRILTERTGGFYIHEDANHNGTAGCIGLTNRRDNRAVHDRISANSSRIPVEVDYPSVASSVTSDAGTGQSVQNALQPSLMLATEPSFSLIQLNNNDEEERRLNPLVEAGIERLRQDCQTHSRGRFPNDYYAVLCRYLFERALRREGNDYGAAFDEMNNLQLGEYGPQLRQAYERIVGTDNTNGWDKFRHFAFTAYLQYHSGGILAPEAFTYGKELWDELEQWVGLDPEGYSIPDIRADNRGEAFAEAMRAREIRENRARLRRELEGVRRAVEGDPAAVEWFMRRVTGM